MKKINPGYKINIFQYPVNLNEINNNNIDNKDDSGELQKKKTRERKVDLIIDLQNKSALNLYSKKASKRSILKSKRSFNNKINLLNDEMNNKLQNLSNKSLLNDLSFPKSSLNIKKHIGNKSFINEKNTSYNKSFLAVNKNNKSFHNKGKLNKTKNNFLKLINPNNKSKVYNDSQCSVTSGKDFVEVLEGDSLNQIEKNLQNKIYDMGRESDFLEFEMGPLEVSINRLNLPKEKHKLGKKKAKKEEDKKKDLTTLQKHKTVVHKTIFNNFTNINSNNSSSEDWLLGNIDKSFVSKNIINFNKKNILSNLHRKLSNNLKNNKLKKYYKINLMKSDVNGRRSSINHYLKSTHSFKSTVINRSKTSSHLKRNSRIDDNYSPKNIDLDINIIPKRKAIFYNMEKFRILSHKKLVYDSLDDEEIIEDAINDTFYFHPDEKIVLIIDSIIFILTFYSMIYKPLKLVLNNCDIKNTITSMSFDNISSLFIDFIFLCDLLINFFKAYYNFDEQLVTNSKKIIINYLKEFFIIDFISGIPYYSIIKIISFKNHESLIIPINCSKYYNHEINDIYQIIELLKLFKLIKCISNKNIITNFIINYLNQFAFFETWLFLLSSSFVTLLILHLTACLHIFVSSTAFPNWIIYKNLDTSNFMKIYLSSIYFLITTVTSVGYGDITGNSITEYIFQIFLLIIGIIAYSWLISSISNYVKEKNQQNEVFNQKLAILNEIKLEHQKFPKELYDKIYLHLEYINLRQKKDKSSLIDSLPHSVKKPLLYEMYKPIIENFNFFKNFKNSEFVNRVISKLKPVLAIKNDLLVEQGEIIEDTIFVKQGRLSLEVKIDTDHPEKSVEKLLNEEYFFGVENNEIYQKSAFGGVINMTSINYNQSFINKKNLYNLYSGNTLIEKNLNGKGVKSIVTNNKGEAEIQKHPKLNINYINLRILDIRKNEHFGALLMFLNKRSPLTLRVKTKKAELFFLKKIDAIEISTSYPNIWKRVNKKSFYNLKQIKKIMKKIIKHFCETYGIDFDFNTTVYNNYNLNSTTLNELKKLKSKKDFEKYRNYNLMNNKIIDIRRPSVGILNSQLKMIQHFPKQTNITTTKTNFEKDIEELIPKNFERTNDINSNKNKKKINYINTIKDNKTNDDNNTESKDDSSQEHEKDVNSPMNCNVSIIKIAKKDTFQGYGHPIYKNHNKNNTELNFNDISIKNSKNSQKNEININKPFILNNNINKENHFNNNEIKNLGKYGEEETNNLMKFFGTPYYPEDINDEVYPGENFEINSQRIQSNTNFEKDFSSMSKILLNYNTPKNNLVNIKNKLLSQSTLKNIDINNKSNNFTINNNYITNNVINNLISQKYNQNLSIFAFSLNYNKLESNKNIKNNENTRLLNLSVFKHSFEISSYRKSDKNIKSKSHVNKININTNKEMKLKKLKTKKSIVEKKKEFSIENKNTNYKRRRVNSCINNLFVNKKNESNSYSSIESLSFSNFSSDSDSNNNDNIFVCKSPIKNRKDSIMSFNRNNNKGYKVNQNIIIKINSKYENLNILTNGKYGKSKKLQDYIKQILNKKLIKYKQSKENQRKKKIRNSASLKLVKHKTMAKKIPENFSKNNLYKVTVAEQKLKKTEVKSLFKKPMISEIHDKHSTIMDKKNRSRLQDSSKISSNTNSLVKRGKTRKKNDDFLLDYVNKNIRDDNAVLNNPGQFYNGLFNNIMKQVTIKKTKKSPK